jgi:hypothetical protein
MKTKKIKFAGPSKKMMDALENEGLNITWPKTIESEDDLAVEGTFTTGADWEKCVAIDLRDEGTLKTKQDVDAAICRQLEEAYEAFDIDEELRLNLEGTAEERRARGVPNAARLLEDMQEQEAFLKRLYDVADAVYHDRPIPSKEDSVEVSISGKDAKRVADILEKIAYWKKSGPWNHEEQAFAKMIVDELRNKVKEA